MNDGPADSGRSKLAVEHVSKYFPGQPPTHVLDDVSLSIGDGEFVSMVGTSGCGKTTLLRIISGLQAPSSGQVRVDGQAVTGPNMALGMVFQNDRLLPWRTVRKNVTLGLELGGRQAGDPRDVDALLELVGLSEFGGYYPYQLSGGMRQRVNMARALAIQPQVLLLDEPFAALDAQTREIMQAEILRIWEETRKTILFVTHQIEEAVYLSDRVVVLRRRPGRVREVVPIELDKPRALSIKRTPAFNDYVERIWSLLEGDIRVAVREDV